MLKNCKRVNAVNMSPSFSKCEINSFFYQVKIFRNIEITLNNSVMSKSMDRKKETKKAPKKSLKEKRAEKRAKKG